MFREKRENYELEKSHELIKKMVSGVGGFWLYSP